MTFTNPLILASLLCLPFAAESISPSADVSPGVVQEDPFASLADALVKVLSTETEETDWFLELYAPSTRERLTDERIRRVLGMFRRDLPDAKLRAIRATGENQAEIILLSTSSGLAARFGVTLEADPPHRILGLAAALEEGDPVVAGIVDGMSAQDMARVIDAFVTELAGEDRFSGAVLLAKDGEPVFEKAWGLASRRFDVPNRVDTRFNLGSMNKMFTAVAICQLAEAGKLDFEDKLIEHLPDYPNRQIAEEVTIHQLLTHTSGMGSFWDAMFERDWTQLRKPADHLDLFASDALLFEPGARFSYSNSGFLVLGLVIEAVSGESYYDYVRANVYEPAGMPNSDSWAMDEPVKNLAIGYTRAGEDGHGHEGPIRNNYYLHRARGGPAGGGFSTVRDLLSFAGAVMESKLLDPEHTQLLLEGKVPTGWGPGSQYAYGFLHQVVEGHDMFGHSGGAPGINAVLSIFPADGYTFVVLANYDNAASYVGSRIQEMITRSDD